MSKRTYMDYNATAPLHPEVRTAMLPALDAPHNASAVHSFGRDARQMVEAARAQVAAVVGAPPAQVIFNSGATEGNNTVLNHFKDEPILISAIEHPSVLEAAPHATRVPVTSDGIVDLDALEDLLKREKPALVSAMLVNNETGVIQPLAEISALAKTHGALVHSDAVQAAGRIPVNLNTLGIDFLTLSAHKIGGPQGTGALVLGLCGITPTLLHGGGQEKKARAGTENVAGIVGFGVAAERAAQNLTDKPEELKQYRDQLETALGKMEITIHGQQVERVTNTTMFSIPGARAESLLMALDLEGIAVSNGSACSSGTVQPSHVLRAMGDDNEEASSALRISLGWASTESDIKRFLEAFTKIYQRIQNKDQNTHA